MTSRRTARVASVIREVVSTTILFELRDPRIKNVTVTRVEVSGDLQMAKIHVSIMADEREQGLCLHGLNSAKGFLQSKLAERIKTRYTPSLRFELDEGIKKSFEVTQILRDVLPDEEGDTAENEDAAENEDISEPEEATGEQPVREESEQG